MRSSLRPLAFGLAGLLSAGAMAQYPYTWIVQGQVSNCYPGQTVNVQTTQGTLPAINWNIAVDSSNCTFTVTIPTTDQLPHVQWSTLCGGTIVTYDDSTFFNALMDTVVTSMGLFCGPQVNDCLGILNGPNVPGTACDDGNPFSMNDAWSGSCVCQGYIPPCNACFTIQPQNTPWTVEFSNCTGGVAPFTYQWNFSDGSASTQTSPTWTIALPGTYIACLTITDANACISTTCDTLFVDSLGGISNIIPWYDCNGVLNGPDTPGSSCDDGDPNTSFDTWTPGCACTGIIGSYDCTGIFNGPNVPGTACVDSIGGGMILTGTWDINCNCVTSGLTDCLGIANGPNMPGTPCSDNNPNTINDTWSPACTCVGTPLPPNCQADFGIWQPSPWVMGLANASTGMGPLVLNWYLPDGSTSNSTSPTYTFTAPGTYGVCLTITTADSCTSTMCDTVFVDTAGVISQAPYYFDCLGVPNGTAVQGTPCQIPGTILQGVWDLNCVCDTSNVLLFDCLNILNGPNMPGTPCNDGDTLTVQDTWSMSCACVGVPVNYYDCLGVMNGLDVPGAPCNDNDPLTVNDTWDANCVCTGGVLQPCNADFWVLQAYTIDSLNSVPVPTPYELWIWNLSSGGTGVYTFLWNFGDGDSSTDAFPTHVYAGNGPYNLCLTISDSNGCQSTSCDSVSIDGNGLYTGMLGVGSDRQNGFTINVKVPQINGVPDAVLAESIATWPNPATDELNIALTNALSGAADVTVMDLEGRVVMAERHMLTNGRNQLRLSTSALSPGMYVVRIGNGTSFISQRFVKTN